MKGVYVDDVQPPEAAGEPEAHSEQDNLGLLEDLHPTVLMALWAIVGLLLSWGALGAGSGVPGALLALGLGLIGAVILTIKRVAGAVAVVPGLLVGVNIFALILLLRPPCASITDLRVVTDRGQVDVVCDRFQDVTASSVTVFAGSLVIAGLLLLLYRVRSRRQPTT